MFMTEKDFAKLLATHPSLAAKNSNSFAQNKYKNKKVYEYSDGYISESRSLTNHGSVTYIFDSVKEYDRWKELILLEKAGEIDKLERQKSFVIQEPFIYHSLKGEQKVNKITYKADFVYCRNGKCIVEDVKPFDNKTQKYRLTKDFALKWKLLMYKYPEYQFIIF